MENKRRLKRKETKEGRNEQRGQVSFFQACEMLHEKAAQPSYARSGAAGRSENDRASLDKVSGPGVAFRCPKGRRLPCVSLALLRLGVCFASIRGEQLFADKTAFEIARTNKQMGGRFIGI